MAKKLNILRWIRIVSKTLFWSIAGVVMLLSTVWILLQTQPVQNYATKKVLVWLSDKTDHGFTIEKIKISWFDELEVNGLTIADYEKNEMARAESIVLNYNLTELVRTRKLLVEGIYLEDGALNITKYTDSTELNLSVFLNSIEGLSGAKDSTSLKEPQPIFLEHIIVENFMLSMHDSTKVKSEESLDFDHINLQTKFLDVERFYLEPDSISLILNDLRMSDEANGINIDHIGAKVGFGPKNLILDDLNISTGNSSLGDSLVLSYSNPANLSHFADSVDFYFRMRNSKLGIRDFSHFTGSNALKDNIYLQMELIGSLGDVHMRDAKIQTGTSRLHLDATLVGLPNIEETFLDFNIKPSQIIAEDLMPYLGEDVPALRVIDRLNVELSFSGFLNDFSTKGSIRTKMGAVVGDMNITIPDNADLMSYTGHIEMEKVNVGQLIGDTSLIQEVSLKGRLLGKGITQETASFLTDFEATNVGLRNYVYDSLAFKGYLAAERFYGQFSVDDPNCKVNGRTNVDLTQSPEKLSLSTTIDTLFTKRLNLTDGDFFLSSRINWTQTHLNPDSIHANLQIKDLVLREDSVRHLQISSIDLETKLDSLQRTLKMTLPGVDLKLNGEYTFVNLVNFLQKEIHDLSNYFELEKELSHKVNEPMRAELTVDFGNLNQYSKFLSPSLTFSNGAKLYMGFEQKEESDAIISLYAQVDSVLYNDDAFYANEIDLYASMDQGSDEILGSFYIASQEQHWKAVPYSERFLTEGVWLNNKIELNTSIKQPDTDTSADLESEINLSSDSLEFSFKPSRLKALGQTWSFDPSNYIKLSKRGLFFRSLDLVSDSKRASLNGLLSDTENSSVGFIARNIDLQQFNSVLGIPVQGIFEADISVFKTLNEPVQFEGDFNLYDFIYKKVKIGDVRGSSFYDKDIEAINATLSVERENVKTISVAGNYFPDLKDQLDFTLVFDRADFKLLEFATEGSLSEVDGHASGELKIRGSTSAPVVSGYCQLQDAKFKVDYLQTVYSMNGKIDFKKDEIALQNIEMRDNRGEKATLSGNIKHQNFDKIVNDLHINAKNFNFLNTTSADNELYYGQANATGDIFVRGPFDDLVLKVNVKTEKGTKFYIPLSDGSSYEQAEFMTFVNLSDTTRNMDELEAVVNSFGLTLDFDLEVTNDAYCELIFDIRTGDIIRGRGAGNLKLRMDKNGNFELFGPLTIEEGGYNFTVPGFINKEFQVVPGSTITWYGDPYTGSMDLSATYLQKASFSDLSSDPSDKEDGELTQKYPVIVILELDGQMLSPTLDFDIALDESVAQNQKITRLLSQVKQDEQQMKRQVVSLLFFKRFSPLQDGFVGGGGGVSIGKSLSEFLTNQISYLASQLDENLEVEVDLTNLDQEGFNTFQLRLAYTFMDGRLKVSRGGDFTSATTEDNNVVSDIIGDWTVEYMLTKDGKFRAKMFSQSNQSRLNADGSQNMETGLSLKYVTSFNNFSDLMGKTRRNAMKRKEEESEVE